MNDLPLFYHKGNLEADTYISLQEDTAKHIVQVLRMKEGDYISITNGNGSRAIAIISKILKRGCNIHIEQVQLSEASLYNKLHLCIAFTKNTSRNEWLLEKAAESGVYSITPLITARTEREKFRTDRWNNILISAMLQSQQFHLPLLHEALPFAIALKQYEQTSQKLIAHCISDLPRTPVSKALLPGKETTVFTGPEGDFTESEVRAAMQSGFTGISLCSQRLRTETAAMSACAYFNLINHE